MDEVIFASGSVPVAVAARVYGKDASWIRAGIISGWLPIGKATRNGKLITNVSHGCLDASVVRKMDRGIQEKQLFTMGCRRAQRFYRRKNISENIGINR